MTSAAAATPPPARFSSTTKSEADRFVAEATLIVTTARALVELDETGASELLRIERNRVFELLGRYQRFKHGVIFDPVIHAGDQAQSAIARLLKCECVLMGEAFSSYFSRWEHVDVAANWLAYRVSMLKMTEQLLEHLRVEHAAITSLLDRA